MQKIAILVFFAGLQLVNALYIKHSAEHGRSQRHAPSPSRAVEDTASNDWNVYKRKLGLTNEKVELLKQQKDQQATVDLLNRFIEENPAYASDPEAEAQPSEDPFLKLYHSLLKKYKNSKSTLKTSLKFELGEGSAKDLKRPRRKIAVRMVSDMPTEQIDDLLKMFSAQHGIDDNVEDQDSDHDQTDDGEDYNDAGARLPSAMDPDYMYENLYEDEEDLAVPAKSHRNSEYGSFQDLILQAKRNQWQREVEETKLHASSNEHFI